MKSGERPRDEDCVRNHRSGCESKEKQSIGVCSDEESKEICVRIKERVMENK